VEKEDKTLQTKKMYSIRREIDEKSINSDFEPRDIVVCCCFTPFKFFIRRLRIANLTISTTLAVWSIGKVLLYHLLCVVMYEIVYFLASVV